MRLKLIEVLADGVQQLHPSMLGICTKKISREAATVVAEVLYDSIVESARLMPDKLAMSGSNSEWSSYTLESFEKLNLDDKSLEREDFKNIIKELIGIANFWKLACSI